MYNNCADNNVSSLLFQQQQGFGIPRTYDAMLHRLRCMLKENHSSIWGQMGNSTQNSTSMVEGPIFACKFATKKGKENYLAMANEDGELVVHNTNSINQTDSPQGERIHHNAIFDLAWFSTSFKLITVSGDHTARLIDIESMKVEQVFVGHTRSVKTVAVREGDNSVFATGSRDGSIRVWDTRCHVENEYLFSDKIIANSHCKMMATSSHKKSHHKQDQAVTSANSVTSLVFHGDNALISCGSGDGLIKVWDLRKTYYNNKPLAMREIPYGGSSTRNGFSNLILDNSRNKLYANCLDNTIYCYNLATYNPNPVAEYVGHKNSTFFIKSALSPDGNYILSGSSDQNAYIWNINNKNPIIKLVGHTAEVTCVAWRKQEPLTLITCSDDFRHKYWHIGTEEIPDNWHVIGCGSAEDFKPFTPSKRLKLHLDANENTPIQQTFTSSLKRRLDDGNTPPDPKRFNSNRRLFALQEITDINEPTCSKYDTLAGILEEEELKTPRASSILHNKDRTPEEVFSPTTNLPNFVIDGNAPHLHFSPQKRMVKDWLTMMRRERKIYRDMEDLTDAGPSYSKVPRLEEQSPCSSNTHKTPKRRNSRASSSGTPKQSPILKFFRVTNNSILNNTQCSPKTSLLSNSNGTLGTAE